MLNFIPALFLLLASGPFGPSSGDAMARVDAPAPKVLVRQLAKELERAGLTAAQAALVVASCEDQPSAKKEISEVVTVFVEPGPATPAEGFARNARTRDGPRE